MCFNNLLFEHLNFLLFIQHTQSKNLKFKLEVRTCSFKHRQEEGRHCQNWLQKRLGSENILKLGNGLISVEPNTVNWKRRHFYLISTQSRVKSYCVYLLYLIKDKSTKRGTINENALVHDYRPKIIILKQNNNRWWWNITFKTK